MEQTQETVAASHEELAEMLRGHTTFYRLMARIMFSPLSQAEVDDLRAAGMPAAGAEPGDENEALLAEGLRLMAEGLAAEGDVRLDLNVDYTGAFYGANQYEGKFATPYESIFMDEVSELYGVSRHLVFNEFKRQALKLKEGLDIPEDHISFELQYMAILEDRAIEALGEGDPSGRAR